MPVKDPTDPLPAFVDVARYLSARPTASARIRQAVWLGTCAEQSLRARVVIRMKPGTDVAIIGAGPYGLSLAAHLRARGVKYRIFGEAMRFWRDMPVGVNLKSLAFATNIAVPKRGYSFPNWCRQHGLEDFEPCTMQSFSTYGLEIQKQFVPDLEEVLVTNVSLRARRIRSRSCLRASVSSRTKWLSVPVFQAWPKFPRSCENWGQTACGTPSIFRIIASFEIRPWRSLGLEHLLSRLVLWCARPGDAVRSLFVARKPSSMAEHRACVLCGRASRTQ